MTLNLDPALSNRDDMVNTDLNGSEAHFSLSSMHLCHLKVKYRPASAFCVRALSILHRAKTSLSGGKGKILQRVASQTIDIMLPRAIP